MLLIGYKKQIGQTELFSADCPIQLKSYHVLLSLILNFMCDNPILPLSLFSSYLSFQQPFIGDELNNKTLTRYPKS